MIPKIVIDVCSRYKSYESFTMGLSVSFDGDTGCLLDRNLWSRTVVSNYRVLIALIMNMNPILTAREAITGILISSGLTGTFVWQNATAMRDAGHGHT